MGLTCEVASTSRQDYQLLRQQNLRPFGRVRILRDNRLNRCVAAKQIHLRDSVQLRDYLKAAALAKQSTSRIPTFLKLNSFNEVQRPNCLQHTVQIEFDYIRQNLFDDIQRRSDRLRSFAEEKKRSMDIQKLDRIQLNDYHRINQLSQEERSYINLHYLESDILRMIDNVAGSVYYLLKYEYEHGGIRPDNVMIDQEGRYLLIDRKLFRLESNYELGLADQPNRVYMSPQEFKSLRERQQFASKSPELSEIYSVGLIALQMANINDNVDRIYDFTCWRANVYELNRLLAQTKQRYSDQLTAMLQKMLYFNESERINLDQLIDVLTPVLESNLEEWEAVFDRSDRQSNESDSGSNKDTQQNQRRTGDTHITERYEPRPSNRNLLARLTQIEQGYHRVMSSKVLNEGRFIREQSLRRDQQRIINKLRETHYTNSSSKKADIRSPDGLSFSQL